MQTGSRGWLTGPGAVGPKPRLSPEQEAQVAAWVEEGPDLVRDGVVRWRCCDLQVRIAHEFHTVLVLDQAGRYTSPKLGMPENISLLPLPAYSPELNPVENLWAYLRGNFLSHRVWNSYDAIVQACCDAWNALMQMPERLTSITYRPRAKAVSK